MKVEEFLRMFPAGGITFTRAERGPGNKRQDCWIVYWSNSYWTSDSDRLTDHVTNHSDRANDTTHEDLETALDMFCQKMLDKAQREVISAHEVLDERVRERERVTEMLAPFIARIER